MLIIFNNTRFFALLLALLVVLSACVGEKTEIHHVFPQQFIHEFQAIGIAVDDFGIILTKEEHRGSNGLHARGWNQQWAAFFTHHQKPTHKQIMMHLQKMLRQAGFLGRVQFVQYRGANRGEKTGEIIVTHANFVLQFLAHFGISLVKLFGATSLGNLLLSFVLASGLIVVGALATQAKHPLAVGFGMISLIFGILAWLGVGYLLLIIYQWLIALCALLLGGFALKWGRA